jgi:hypothetical protein
VAYYPFHGNANDASGNGNNGTNYGATFVTNRFGLANAAAYFNQSYIVTGFFPPLGTAARTFSGWFKVPPSPNAMAILAYGGNSVYPEDRFELDVGYDFPGSFVLNGSYSGIWTTNTYDDSNWHSFAVVVPTNATLSNAIFYMDGILQANLDLSGPVDAFNTSNVYPLQFGQGYLSGGFGPLVGALSDVRVYNRALSSNEVTQLHAFESVSPLPSITQDLTNIFVQYGFNTSIGVTVTSPTPVNYQWYFVPANGAGQAAAYAQSYNGFIVGAVVTNGGFGYGNTPHVSFVGGGGSGASGFGTNINGILTGIAVTNAGVGYASLPSVVIDPPNGFLFGQTNSTLTISNANQNNLGNYFVVVSNAMGSVTSSVVNLTLLYPPSITSEPQDQAVKAYSAASFAVGASGTLPLSYQWFANGSILPGATASTLTFPSVTPPELGTYSVIVTNSFGSITSSIANLFLSPYLDMPFTGFETYLGQTNTLSVGAWGSGGLVYQWYLNGVAIAGATSSNLVLSGIQFTNAGSYTVVVSSPYGSVTNTPEQVVVNPANTSIGLFAGVIIQGTVGYNYTIQSSTNLGDANSWITLTNLTLTSPIQIWDDNSVDVHKYPQNFYRVLSGQ